MITWNNIRICIDVIKKEGASVFLKKVYCFLRRNQSYSIWIKQNEKEDTVIALRYNPLISIIVPIYNVKKQILKECIDSVLNQIYTNYELCLVDDCSTLEEVRDLLKEYETNDKIKIVYRKENGHISKATNSGLSIATGEFIGLLDCDDLLTPNALYEVVKLLNENSELDYIYSDEDKVTEDGKERKDPFFKPDWSPDTFMSLMYTCHFSVFRKTIVDKLHGMRIGFEGCQDYDLVLRIMEVTNKIGHIPKILYHWREREESTALNLDAKTYIIENAQKMKLEALERRGLKGQLEFVSEISQYRIVYNPIGNPKVSIIILSKDNYEILEKCIKSIKKFTNYTNYEIIVVDNGSQIENKKKTEHLCDSYNMSYIYYKNEFNFSEMCNRGAKNATGDYLLFLNDDIEVQQNDWLERMLGHAQLEHVGAVGAKLYYPNTNRIQHAGVLNLETGPCHALYNMNDDVNIYFGRNILDYNFSIVTGACFMVKASRFHALGGFDEKFPVCYNDVELCFRLLKNGYYNVLRNDVVLIHHESISRGYERENKDKEAKRKDSLALLYKLYPEYEGKDSCYNFNLIQTRGDYSIRL